MNESSASPVKKALITGVNGQDGSYLAELLLAKGYEVHGLARRVTLEADSRRLEHIRSLRDRLHIHSASLESYPALYRAITRIQPDEVYHLAAASFVSYDFDDEFSTLTANINGTHYLLACIKEIVPHCRFYFAGTSEMFGAAESSPQDEATRFRPRAIYGISKVAGFELTRNYRERYDLYAASGILFNHESPRRGFEFVTRKITSTVARIRAGRATELRLGNLAPLRDWGDAREYVDAMWRMLQQPTPGDYVIATGKLHSVKDFVRIAFEAAGLDWERYVVVDQEFFRPAEKVPLCGNPAKARRELGWEATTPFDELVREMVANDCRLAGVDL